MIEDDSSASSLKILNSGLYYMQCCQYFSHSGSVAIKLNDNTISTGSGYAGSTGIAAAILFLNQNDIITLTTNALDNNTVRVLFNF